MVIGAATENQWKKFCEVLGVADLATDARFLSNAERVKKKQELSEILSNLVLQFDNAYLVSKFE